jgi:hypothetical protein
MMNLKNLQKEFASKQLLTNEGMAMVKGGLAIPSKTSTTTTASVTSVTSDDKRRERPGGGIG